MENFSTIIDDNEDKSKINFTNAFKLLVPLGALLHVIFLIIFYFKGVTPLFYYNIFSILLYLVINFYTMEKHMLLSIAFVYFEVLVHSILCCILIGWTGGFYVYPLCLIPITYFVTTNISRNLKYGHLSAALILINYQFWNIFTKNKTSLYGDLFSTERDIIYNINTIAATIILIILLFSFLYEMRHVQDMLEKKNKILNNLANFDVLTELRNRRSMIERINLKIEKYNKDCNNFFLAISDIDNFKKFNDTYGHDCGDIVLKSIAQVFKTNCERFNIEASRWGGEEFLILIKESDPERAKKICNCILEDIRSLNIHYNEENMKVTMTMGCASFKDEMSDFNATLKKADENLYIGKGSTKNCLVMD